MRSKAREDIQVGHNNQEDNSVATGILPGSTGGGDSGFFDFTDEEGKILEMKQDDQHAQADVTEYIRPRRTSKKLQPLNVRSFHMRCVVHYGTYFMRECVL